MIDSAVARQSSLTPGLMIGQYVVGSPIGAGGMGEVYRATDSRLGRDVALKILPEMYGANADRIRRFELEARSTSKLNHPNIVSIFDTGEHEGRPYFVTELLEGHPLSAIMRETPQLPIRRILEAGIQIARGLAAAHEKGIIHRDLKPANVFVLRDGHVKILDFGLAKLTQVETEPPDADNETLSGPGTAAGRVLGSAGYMSPEQVEARPIDARSDLFSLGVILYEMLTGSRAFRGESVAGTMSAILRDDPQDVLALRPDAPVALVQVVRRCLEKSAADRFQSARDLSFNLEELISRSDVSLSSAARSAIRGFVGRMPRRRVIGFGSILALVVATLLILLWNGRSGADAQPKGQPPQLMRVTSSGRILPVVALSPDQSYIVTAAESGKGAVLSLLHVATGSTTALATADAESFGAALFSPDGNFVYFTRFEDGGMNLYRVPLLGGQAQRIARDTSGALTMRPDGAEIAFVRTQDEAKVKALVAVSSDGSSERTIATLSSTKIALSECAWSPNATRLVCGSGQIGAMSEIDAATGTIRTLLHLPPLVWMVWTPDGKSLIGTTRYAEGSQVVRVDVDTGAAVPVTSELGQYGPLAISRDGLTVAAARIDNRIHLWSLSIDDPSELRQITSGANTQDGNFGIATAPDGRIVWSSKGAGKSIDLWIGAADGANSRRLTLHDDTDETWPDVSPDGRYVVYRRDTPGPDGISRDLWQIEIESGSVERLTSTGDAFAGSYTGDGASIIFHREVGDETFVFEIPSAGGDPRQVDGRQALAPRPSPDGKWLLVSAEGKNELWPSDGAGEARRLPIGARMKKWRPDSRAFAYRGKGGHLWMFEIESGESRQLTRLDHWDFPVAFAWSPDGNEVIFARSTQSRDIFLIRGVQ